MSAFSETLVAMRREAGFPTAYRFYHSNGGRAHFGFTYTHYLRIERGTKAPRAESLGALLKALRQPPSQEAGRRLVRVFLRDALGSAEAYDLVAGSITESAPSSDPSLAQRGFDRLKREHVIHMSVEQFTAVAGDKVAYWTSEFLLNDTGSWSAAQVAQRLSCPAAKAAAALKRLARVGLLRETSPGRFKTRQPGKFWTYPGRADGMGALLDRVRGYWDAASSGRGAAFGERLELVRATETTMRQYLDALYRVVDESNLAAVHSGGEDTALYLIEGRVRRLLSY